ncbi:MAG: hypothetical protein WCJ72_12560, partial [Chryseobacterium sp.]
MMPTNGVSKLSNVYDFKIETGLKPDLMERIGYGFITPYQKQEGYHQIKVDDINASKHPIEVTVEKTDKFSISFFNFLYTKV